MKKIIFAILCLSLLTNCSGTDFFKAQEEAQEKPTPGIFSRDSKKGISITELLSPQQNNSINNVNAHLWRATLNVLSVAPLISTDALGGTIITDWYVNEKIKNQRIKISAFITTSELRSDGINIKVHVQNLKNGNWTDTVTDKNLAIQIENNILNEARISRINSLR
jgi:hypothetical protein|tara:strand:- start:336 stop:833 length:498 start_codon:yes stop_codon:yes gene_type:complete